MEEKESTYFYSSSGRYIWSLYLSYRWRNSGTGRSKIFSKKTQWKLKSQYLNPLNCDVIPSRIDVRVISVSLRCLHGCKMLSQATACSLSPKHPQLLPSCFHVLHRFTFSFFPFSCIRKMRSSCEPCRSPIGLWVQLPLLTTNSLPGGRQFPLHCYNLFGFQVPCEIKTNLFSSHASCLHSDRDTLSSCVPMGTLSAANHVPGQESVCASMIETEGCVWAWGELGPTSNTF